MHDLEALIQTIRAEPGETSWSICSDYLEEQGDERAEWIRVMLGLRRHFREAYGLLSTRLPQPASPTYVRPQLIKKWSAAAGELWLACALLAAALEVRTAGQVLHESLAGLLRTEATELFLLLAGLRDVPDYVKLLRTLEPFLIYAARETINYHFARLIYLFHRSGRPERCNWHDLHEATGAIADTVSRSVDRWEKVPTIPDLSTSKQLQLRTVIWLTREVGYAVEAEQERLRQGGTRFGYRPGLIEDESHAEVAASIKDLQQTIREL